jgi:hypothetical protein
MSHPKHQEVSLQTVRAQKASIKACPVCTVFQPLLMQALHTNRSSHIHHHREFNNITIAASAVMLWGQMQAQQQAMLS